VPRAMTTGRAHYVRARRDGPPRCAPGAARVLPRAMPGTQLDDPPRGAPGSSSCEPVWQSSKIVSARREEYRSQRTNANRRASPPGSCRLRARLERPRTEVGVQDQPRARSEAFSAAFGTGQPAAAPPEQLRVPQRNSLSLEFSFQTVPLLTALPEKTASHRTESGCCRRPFAMPLSDRPAESCRLEARRHETAGRG